MIGKMQRDRRHRDGEDHLRESANASKDKNNHATLVHQLHESAGGFPLFLNQVLNNGASQFRERKLAGRKGHREEKCNRGEDTHRRDGYCRFDHRCAKKLKRSWRCRANISSFSSGSA